MTKFKSNYKKIFSRYKIPILLITAILFIITILTVNSLALKQNLSFFSQARTPTRTPCLSCTALCDEDSQIDCTDPANSLKCNGITYQCLTTAFPKCCMPGHTSTPGPNLPTAVPTQTCLSECPRGHCLTYENPISNDDYKGRQQKNPNNIRTGNGRDDVLAEALATNNPLFAKNGCYDITTGDSLREPNQNVYDQEPFPYLSGKNCTEGSLIPYPDNPFGDQLRNWFEGGICCLDYKTYKNAKICPNIISPTPTISICPGQCYANPQTAGTGSYIFAPEACKRKGFTTSPFCNIPPPSPRPTITLTPTPTFVPTPTSECPVNTYCGKKIVSGRTNTICDQPGTSELQPTISCKYRTTDPLNLTTITKTGSCCGLVPSPTFIPTMTPIPPTPLINCPDPQTNCSINCGWPRENLINVGKAGCPGAKHCCLTPTPTLAPVLVTSCPQPAANCLDTVFWPNGVDGCPHDRINITTARDCGFLNTCCLPLGTIEDTETCEKNGGRCVKNKYSCTDGLGNGNDVEVGKCDSKWFTGYKCCR